ncbi:hypothetical protein Bca101_084889 [Brassica carinata]
MDGKNISVPKFQFPRLVTVKALCAALMLSLSQHIGKYLHPQRTEFHCYQHQVIPHLLELLSWDDLEYVIATGMVLQYGWGPDDSPAVYYATNAVHVFLKFDTISVHYDVSSDICLIYSIQWNRFIYGLAYEKAKGMLLKNRRVLEKITEELLEFEILTQKDLERLVNENGGIREKEPFFLSGTNYNEASLCFSLQVLSTLSWMLAPIGLSLLLGTDSKRMALAVPLVQSMLSLVVGWPEETSHRMVGDVDYSSTSSKYGVWDDLDKLRVQETIILVGRGEFRRSHCS